MTNVTNMTAPDEAQARFDRGDFVGARQAAERALGTGTAEPHTAAQTAARDLLARLAPDPWALRFGLLALAVLALIVGLYVRH